MTRDDTFVEQLENYLDEYEGLTPLPDLVRDDVRAALREDRALRAGTDQVGRRGRRDALPERAAASAAITHAAADTPPHR